jgi:hypothetical protein
MGLNQLQRYIEGIEKRPMLQADAGTLSMSACLALIEFVLRYKIGFPLV